MASEKKAILLAVGAQGLALNIPVGIRTAGVSPAPEGEGGRDARGTVQPGLALGPLDQQVLVKAALEKPQSGPALKELAKGHRRVTVLVGGLALPAPYEIALPAVVQDLVSAEIRPSRISFVVCSSTSAPILGRAAIHRYGEEIVGDHEVRAWQWSGENGDQPDAGYAASDLKIAVVPKLENADALLPDNLAIDATLELTLGNKARIDIVEAKFYSGAPKRCAAAPKKTDTDVVLASGGGVEWESTLEEALATLHYMEADSKTAVLAFTGDEGLGSALFTNDFWTLLEQADEILAGGKSLNGLMPRPRSFEAANVIAYALSHFDRLVLWSRGLAEHVDGDDLMERLKGMPEVSKHLSVCSSEAEVWTALSSAHGESYSLSVLPLGWREWA